MLIVLVDMKTEMMDLRNRHQQQQARPVPPPKPKIVEKVPSEDFKAMEQLIVVLR